MKSRFNARTIKRPEELGLFLVPRSEREYDAAVEQLNDLADEIGDSPGNPRYRLIETLSALVEAYDRDHHPMSDVSGVDMVRFLMKQHTLTQRDLPEIGSQGVVSEILSGRRQLNLRQIRALAKRFGVSAASFLPDGE